VAKENKNKGCVVGLVVLTVLCCLCTSVTGGISWIFRDEIGQYLDQIDTVNSTSNYLNYKVKPVTVETVKDVNDQLFLMYNNLEELAAYEEYMYQAAQVADPDQFFDNYSSFNEKMGEIMGQTEAIAEFYDSDNDALGIISVVEAKERSSWKYWIPIYGSLLKAKHKSIETSRAGVYNYLKNELDPVDRQNFLDTYKLDSVEDLRKVDDATVEKLARDPELRAGIDWTKVTKDLGETAIKTTVEGIKTATGGSIPNPVKDTYDNAVADIRDGKIDSVEDEMPPAPEKQEPTDRVTFGVKKSIQTKIDKELEKQGKSIEDSIKWDEIKSSIQDSIESAVNSVIKDEGPVAVGYKPGDMEDFNAVQVPPGIWDLLSTTIGTVPVELDEVELNEGKVTKITKPTLDITEYIGYTGPEIVEITSQLEEKTEVTVTQESPDPSWWDGSYPSCPFIYLKTENGWELQNDLISVARSDTRMSKDIQKSKQYTDYLMLKDSPKGNSQYNFKVREIRDETTYLDSLSVHSVKHDKDVQVSNDMDGNILGYRDSDLQVPQNSNKGEDVLDNKGRMIYNKDVLEYDFSNVEVHDNSVLVLNLDGFEGKPVGNTYERPRLIFKTQDQEGKWIERDFVYPREYFSLYAMNTKGWFEYSRKLQIEVYSCHEEKYHVLDFIGIDPEMEEVLVKEMNISYLLEDGIDQDMSESLSSVDNKYLVMPSLSWFSFSTESVETEDNQQVSIMVESTGYYVANK
jgi:hypothetical protein